ncbi:MAG: hypothetical protein MRY63_13440 [Neomegalonema sp.]|nr:hypothetical protein [Neomegalonema sp.]
MNKRSLFRIFTALGLSLATAACTLPEARRPQIIPSQSHRLVQPPRPPELIARDAAQAAQVAQSASPARLATLSARHGSKRLEPSQLAFFHLYPPGRAYVAAGPGRAIARGTPVKSCPQESIIIGAAGSEQAAGHALRACLAQRDDASDCGCRLIAVEDVLLTTSDAFNFAQGVSASLYPGTGSRAARAPLPLVATPALPSPDHDLAVLLRDAREIRALVEMSRDGSARMQLPNGTRLPGRAWIEGFRRGRLAGVMRFEAANGRDAVLLLGYEPGEIAEREAELLRRARRLPR